MDVIEKKRAGRPPIDKHRPRYVSAREFAAWQKALAISDSEAARRLGVAPNSIANYNREGAPGRLGLAMLAVSAELREYSESNRVRAERAARVLKAIG